jgi:DNA modification methylase
MSSTETAPLPGSKARRAVGGAESNKLEVADRPAHGWYRFVLSYPPHLVRHYLSQFGVQPGDSVLDPFCGTGTTLVECKKLGLNSVGVEAHPMSHFATATKVNWDLNPEHLERSAKDVAERALEQLDRDGIVDDFQPYLVQETCAAKVLRQLPEQEQKLLLTNSISPLPLHKVLVLLEAIGNAEYGRSHMHLALAKALVTRISNLQFGPEVGVGPPKGDAPVVSAWLGLIMQMAADLRLLSRTPDGGAVVHHADSRQVSQLIPLKSIDAVITSPPYPNEKDYTRTTRLESVVLGFFRNRQELQRLKRTMLRSNTRGVYIGDDDDRWVAHHPEIRRIAEAIETRRIELNKTSGFERLYARVAKLYFGGMARHLAELRPFLRPGARLAYVVGDQASYLRVMIRTGEILASLAAELGYVVEKIDLFRTRLSTATREQLREEVLVLRWPGGT